MILPFELLILGTVHFIMLKGNLIVIVFILLQEVSQSCLKALCFLSVCIVPTKVIPVTLVITIHDFRL